MTVQLARTWYFNESDCSLDGHVEWMIRQVDLEQAAPGEEEGWGEIKQSKVIYEEKTKCFLHLKELSHEIEMCCWWYGWIETYLEMNL
jgi:hypothetical protein